jgi:tRNA pseudouridine55 synthase
VCLDKPLDLTSTDAVSRVRRVFNAQKAGHAGTLDPLATGVLPIALGEATKTVPFLMDADKTYRFTVAWGAMTASFDREGEVIATSDVRPSPEQVAGVLHRFVGEIDQVPPAFSAVRVNGERAYDLAREGVELDLAARRVVIHSAEVTGAPDADHVEIEISCGKGTYVRALARDLARRWALAGTFRPCGARAWGRSPPRTASRWISSPDCARRAASGRPCSPSRPRWTTSRRWP